MAGDYQTGPTTDSYSHVVTLLHQFYGRYHSDSVQIGGGVERIVFDEKPDGTIGSMREIEQELREAILAFPNRAEASHAVLKLLRELDGPEITLMTARQWGVYCSIRHEIEDEELRADAKAMVAKYFRTGNGAGLDIVLNGMGPKYLDERTLMDVITYIAQHDGATYNPVQAFIEDVLAGRKGLFNYVTDGTLARVIGVLLRTDNFSSISVSLRGIDLIDGGASKRDDCIRHELDSYMRELLRSGRYETARSMAGALLKIHPNQALIFAEHCASNNVPGGIDYLVYFASSSALFETGEKPNYGIQQSIHDAFIKVIERLVKEAEGQEKPALQYAHEMLNAAIEKANPNEQGLGYVKERIELAFVLFKHNSPGIIDSAALAGKVFPARQHSTLAPDPVISQKPVKMRTG